MAYSIQQRGEGPWYLHIENLPRKYTWQDLKDLIRRQATHGIWTEMALQTQDQTSGNGFARVKKTDEARNLYKYLTENIIEKRRLQVHLWDISAAPAQFVCCNCGNDPGSHSPSAYVSQLAVGPGWHTFNVTSPTLMAQPSPYQAPMTLSQAVPMPLQQALPVQPPPQPALTQQQIIAGMCQMGLSPQSPQHVAYFKQQLQFRQVQQAQQAQIVAGQQLCYPMYIASSTGTPINVTQGAIRVEARGIFVSNLPYKARQRDIETHFRSAGDIIRVDLQKDPQSGKSKGNATIQFACAEHAQNAVDEFHGQDFMGMRLNVRPDKERTAISAPTTANASGSGGRQTPQRSSTMEPTIVNGSQVSSVA